MTYPLTRPSHISIEQWERCMRDLETYRQQLPRLLREGHAGRYALIREGQVLSLWDTVGDALQAAGETFGMEPVATFKINPLDLQRFAVVDAPSHPGKEAMCPF